MGKHPLYNNSGLQKNNKSHVMYALANKQIELKKLKDEYEAKILKVKSDLEAMKQVICLFDDDCSSTIDKINTHTDNKQKKSAATRLFKNGELKKLILNILRKSNSPLKSDDIALEIIEIKEFEFNDGIIKKVKKAISSQANLLEKDGLIEALGKDGLNILWKIKD